MFWENPTNYVHSLRLACSSCMRHTSTHDPFISLFLSMLTSWPSNSPSTCSYLSNMISVCSHEIIIIMFVSACVQRLDTAKLYPFLKRVHRRVNDISNSWDSLSSFNCGRVCKLNSCNPFLSFGMQFLEIQISLLSKCGRWFRTYRVVSINFSFFYNPVIG